MPVFVSLMAGKFTAFRRRFPNFWLAVIIGFPIGCSLWLASIFLPCYGILQAPQGVNQLNVHIENGYVYTTDMQWHGAGNPPTNWWTLDNHIVVPLHRVKFTDTAMPNEEGWAYFLGLNDSIIGRDAEIPGYMHVATWTLMPGLVFIVWVVLRLSRLRQHAS